MDVTPLTRVFRLYRAMGIRHLPVTNIENEVVGILTRKELRTDFSHDLCALHSRRARAWAAVWYMAVGLLSSELALLCSSRCPHRTRTAHGRAGARGPWAD